MACWPGVSKDRALCYLAGGMAAMSIASLGALFTVEYWVLVTSLGSTGFYLALLPIVYHSLHARHSMVVASSLMVTAGITGAAKELIALPRPPRELWLVEASGYGFPSGHASGSSSFWSSLSLVRPRPCLMALSVVIVTFVSVSRVVLGVHFLRDVAGGILLGLLVAALIYAASGRLGEGAFKALLLAAPLAIIASYSYLGIGEPEVYGAPSALVGVVLAEIVGARRGEPLGWRLGAVGSLFAIIFGLTGLELGEAYGPPVSIALFMLSGYSAVQAPRLLERVLGGIFSV